MKACDLTKSLNNTIKGIKRLSPDLKEVALSWLSDWCLMQVWLPVYPKPTSRSDPETPFALLQQHLLALDETDFSVPPLQK